MTVNAISENLSSIKPVAGGEAEGNCVVVRRGGKQPNAKEQSQIQVNSIQLMPSASLLAIGEACVERNLECCHRLEIGVLRGCMCGWSGNVAKDVYVNGESCMDRHRTQVRTLQQSEPPYELRDLVTRMEQREAGK